LENRGKDSSSHLIPLSHFERGCLRGRSNPTTRDAPDDVHARCTWRIRRRHCHPGSAGAYSPRANTAKESSQIIRKP